MNETAIQSVRHELEQALVHLTQASDLLARYLNDNDVYQIWCLIPVSGVRRLLSWLKAIKPEEASA